MAETAVKEKVEEETKGGSKKMLLIGLFVGVAVVAAYFMLFAKPAVPEDGEAMAEPTVAPVEEGDIYEVATLTVNLDSADLRYARVQFGVVTDGVMAADPTARFPLLQDMAISTIAGFTPAELRTVEGHEQLRTRLTEDALEVWPDGEVLRVILYDLIVQ